MHHHCPAVGLVLSAKVNIKKKEKEETKNERRGNILIIQYFYLLLHIRKNKFQPLGLPTWIKIMGCLYSKYVQQWYKMKLIQTITISSAVPYSNQTNESYVSMAKFVTSHNECLLETYIQESQEIIPCYWSLNLTAYGEQQIAYLQSSLHHTR